MSEWAVQLDRVSFTYEGTQREILHEVSLNVKPGEFLTIVGPNGAGKSTLVRTMIGLNRPTSGRVLVEGKDLSKLTVAQLSRTVGFLFQNPDHQLFEDTVYREIAAGPVNMGLPEEQVDQIVKENMDFCSLTPLAERAPEDLSVGEKKRTAVAAVGSDDGSKVWFNGREILASNTSRGAVRGQDRANVTLMTGWNVVLLKVTQGDGGWGFYFDLLDPATGQPLEDLVYSPTPGGRL